MASIDDKLVVQGGLHRDRAHLRERHHELLGWTGWAHLDAGAAAHIAMANRVPVPSNRELALAPERLRVVMGSGDWPPAMPDVRDRTLR
jgi:hypothetical protein